MDRAGKLYLVATPIGNLEDITLRALKVLQNVDIIAAEDTRQTLKLLNHYEIKKPMISYHEHNRVSKGEYLINKLLEGESIALVSDAGCPGISDPGEDIVRLAAEHGIECTMIPGPSAAITGLVLSGMPAGRFVFEGFLPVNKKGRKERILALEKEDRTIIIYEAPHKLARTLNDLYKILGNRKIVLARELTKKFEEVVRSTLKEAIEYYANNIPRGEYVLVLEGSGNKPPDLGDECAAQVDAGIAEQVESYIKEGLSKKEAIKKTAKDMRLPKRTVYNQLLDEHKKQKGLE